MSALPPTGPAAPPPAGGAMGTTSATQPVPNRGLEVMGRQGLALVVKLMGELIPKLASDQEAQTAVMDAMRKLQKFSSPAAPASQQNQMRDLMQRQQQMSQLPQKAPAPGAVPPHPPGA